MLRQLYLLRNLPLHLAESSIPHAHFLQILFLFSLNVSKWEPRLLLHDLDFVLNLLKLLVSLLWIFFSMKALSLLLIGFDGLINILRHRYIVVVVVVT